MAVLVTGSELDLACPDMIRNVVRAISPYVIVNAGAYPTPAKRPGNSALDTGKLRSAFGLDLPHWTLGVDQVLGNLLKVHQ